MDGVSSPWGSPGRFSSQISATSTHPVTGRGWLWAAAQRGRVCGRLAGGAPGCRGAPGNCLCPINPRARLLDAGHGRVCWAALPLLLGTGGGGRKSSRKCIHRPVLLQGAGLEVWGCLESFRVCLCWAARNHHWGFCCRAWGWGSAVGSPASLHGAALAPAALPPLVLPRLARRRPHCHQRSHSVFPRAPRKRGVERRNWLKSAGGSQIPAGPGCPARNVELWAPARLSRLGRVVPKHPKPLGAGGCRQAALSIPAPAPLRPGAAGALIPWGWGLGPPVLSRGNSWLRVESKRGRGRRRGRPSALLNAFWSNPGVASTSSQPVAVLRADLRERTSTACFREGSTPPRAPGQVPALPEGRRSLHSRR